jgi:SAM-dependent methyltransferase
MMRCNLCESDRVTELGRLGPKPFSVTSDSKLCEFQVKIHVCRECNHLQKFYSEADQKVVDSIYSNYAAHHLSQGNEQLVFPENLPPRPRTYHALEQCLPFLATEGCLLDVGTGNGAVLKSASKLLPGWSFHAFDIGDANREAILKIPNVVAFHSGDFPAGKFDLIVLWHALEHVPAPPRLLADLRERLNADGYLLIQVPDVDRNPFDLGVIDHCSHFGKARLVELVRSLGYQVSADGYEWTHNCLTLLLKKDEASRSEKPVHVAGSNPERHFHWLNDTVRYFETAIADSAYAVFGTGMASIWLSSQLTHRPGFFIDEDSTKEGSSINGIPIVMPDGVPEGLSIVMPFTHDTGKSISLKLQRLYSSYDRRNFLLIPPVQAPGGDNPRD